MKIFFHEFTDFFQTVMSVTWNRPNIELLHNQLQNLQNETQRGVQIRSREKMILNEEKPTNNFFYIQEQQKNKRKPLTN